MRVKAAKTEKKAKAVRGLGVGAGDGQVKEGRVFEKPRLDGVGLGAVGKPWAVQPGVESQAKDRSLAAPALPVPIASFNI
jgi:hypothetical protein